MPEALLYDRPQLWEVCEACNYVQHRCHFCGADLIHEDDGTVHPCYVREREA